MTTPIEDARTSLYSFVQELSEKKQDGASEAKKSNPGLEQTDTNIGQIFNKVLRLLQKFPPLIEEREALGPLQNHFAESPLSQTPEFSLFSKLIEQPQITLLHEAGELEVFSPLLVFQSDVIKKRWCGGAEWDLRSLDLTRYSQTEVEHLVECLGASNQTGMIRPEDSLVFLEFGELYGMAMLSSCSVFACAEHWEELFFTEFSVKKSVTLQPSLDPKARTTAVSVPTLNLLQHLDSKSRLASFFLQKIGEIPVREFTHPREETRGYIDELKATFKGVLSPSTFLEVKNSPITGFHLQEMLLDIKIASFSFTSCINLDVNIFHYFKYQNLEHVDLSEDIQVFDCHLAPFLPNLTNLVSLNLGGTSITTETVEKLPQQLISLSLEGCKHLGFKKMHKQAFSHLKSLKELSLHKVNCFDDEYINYFPLSLEKLDLAYCRFFCPKGLRGLQSLKSLDLSNTQLANIFFDYAPPNLESLYLTSCVKLSAKIESKIQGLSLTSCDVRGTGLSQSLNTDEFLVKSVKK